MYRTIGTGHGAGMTSITIRTISIISRRWSSSSTPAKIGMWLFLATEILLFGGLFVGFGMMQDRYPREFVEAHEHLSALAGRVEHRRAAVFQLHHGDGGQSAKTSNKQEARFVPDR